MSAFLIDRSNDVLKVNRPNAGRNLSVNGSNWLWAATAVMGLTFLSWLAWTISRNKQRGVPRDSRHHNSKNSNINNVDNGVHKSQAPAVSPLHTERIFHYLFTIAAFITFITYFTMASNLGNTPIRQYMNHGTDSLQTRQIFYVRYIYYVTAWPLVLTATLLLSGISWATIVFIAALQEIWVVSWLCGALVTTSYKWGFFAFGLFAYLVLAYLLLSWGVQHARRIRTEKDYTLLAGLLVVVWMLYPISWGLSEGSNKLSITGEMIFYGVLDIIAIPVYGTLFLILVNKHLDPALFPFTQSGRVSDLNHATRPHTSALATPTRVPAQGEMV